MAGAIRPAAADGLDIGIVGAGIGGLTLALACREAGLPDVTVYEQAREVRGLGAGVQLSPNASRVLIALGLRQALEQIAFHPEAVHLRGWRSGYLIASRPLGEFSRARYGAPYYHVHRGDLHALLLEAAQQRGVRLHSGRRVSGVGGDLEQQPRIELANGTDGTDGTDDAVGHDVVIGCDGIHSAVRGSLFDAARPRFTGHVAWRAMVPAAELSELRLPPTATVWLGPRRHFVHYFVRGGELVNFVGVIESDRWTGESWSEAGDPAELAADFDGWHPMVRRLIDAAPEAWRWALYDHDPLPTWQRGRVSLLGDACHPMLPYLAQGAAMAIEDAWVLSRMLERWEDQPDQGLAEYERYRRPRTARVQLRSRAQGEEFHLHEPWPRLQRNVKMILGSRYLPEIAMSQFDWLHGYDCIRGFE